MDVTVGTLSGGDLRALEEWGVVGLEDEQEGEGDGDGEEGHSGIPWFNDLVAGSRLGRGTTRMRGERREGRGWRVEWEIVEWVEGDDEPASTAVDVEIPLSGGNGKRKIGEVEGDVEGGDTSMQG